MPHDPLKRCSICGWRIDEPASKAILASDHAPHADPLGELEDVCVYCWRIRVMITRAPLLDIPLGGRGALD